MCHLTNEIWKAAAPEILVYFYKCRQLTARELFCFMGIIAIYISSAFGFIS